MKSVAIPENGDTSRRAKVSQRAKKSKAAANGYNEREEHYLRCGLELQQEPVAHYHHNDCSDEPVLWAPYQNGGGAAGNHDHDEMPRVPVGRRAQVTPVTESVSDDTRLNKEIYGPSTERYSPTGLIEWQQYEKSGG